MDDVASANSRHSRRRRRPFADCAPGHAERYVMSHDASITPDLHVVVVGAGFGGLSAVQALRGAPVRVTVIDQRNHHLFQPLLYQVATGGLSPAEIAAPIRPIVGKQPGVTVILGEVFGIDPDHHCVQVKDKAGVVAYDYLMVATGARHSYFGHDEWAPLVPGLKTVEDATFIRWQILLAFERAETEGDGAERERLLTFVIIGGGP